MLLPLRSLRHFNQDQFSCFLHYERLFVGFEGACDTFNAVERSVRVLNREVELMRPVVPRPLQFV